MEGTSKRQLHPRSVRAAARSEKIQSDTSCTSFNGDSSDFHHNLALKRKLVVYTTRLDNMKIVLQPFHAHNFAEFYEEVLRESKPQVTARSFKRRELWNKKYSNLISFLTLKYKIDRVNMTVIRKKGNSKQRRQLQLWELESEVRGKSSEIDNTLKKIVIHLANAKRNSHNRKQIDNETIEAVTKTQLHMLRIPYHNNSFILKNTKTNESDIYYINDKGLITNYYHAKDNLNSFLECTLKPIEMTYCCWYHRKSLINLMSLFVPVTAIKYLIKPHSCVGECTCCCKSTTENTNESEESNNASLRLSFEAATSVYIIEYNMERIVTPVAPKVLIENMLSSVPAPLISSLIQKAFAYTPQDKPRLTTYKEKTLNLFKAIKLLFNYENGNEFYEIGSEGEIIQHLRNCSETFIVEQVGGGNIIHEKICCWFMRDKLLNSLRKNNMQGNTWKYMKTRHTCPVDKCVCCCNPLIPYIGINKTILKQITLPEIPNCTSELSDQSAPLKFIFAKHDPKENEKSVEKCSATAKLTKQTSISTIKYFEDPQVPENVIVSYEDQEVNDIDKTEVERRRHISANTKHILEEKLPKLKNISVYISPEAKINVKLNVPVTDLSTDELKTLNITLVQAQKNIDHPQHRPWNKFINTAQNVACPSDLNNVLTDVTCNRNLQRYDVYSAVASRSNLQSDSFLKSFRSLLRTINYSKPKRRSHKSLNASQNNSQSRTKRKNNLTQNTDEELPRKNRPSRGSKSTKKVSNETLRDPNIKPLQLLEEGQTLDNQGNAKLSKDEMSTVFPDPLAFRATDYLTSEDATNHPSLSEEPLDDNEQFILNDVTCDEVVKAFYETPIPICEEVNISQDDDDCILGI